MATKMIPLDQIGYDKKYYPRVNGIADWFTVNKYRDALLSDARKEFPPIVLVKVTGKKWAYMILDGLHRLTGYGAAQREVIPAEIEHLPESKWFARSVELNIIHGRQLDTGDKAFIAMRLESEGYSAEEAAKLLQMRVETMEKIKAQHIQRIKATGAKDIPEGRGHRVFGTKHFGFIKAPFKDFAGTSKGEEALLAQGPVSSSSVLNILDSCIAILECGVDMADEGIVTRIERIRAILPDNFLPTNVSA